MKMGGGEGGGGGGGGAAGIGMRPGAPRLVHSGPETPPLLGLPPPLPPTWLQRSAQAGPAGGREGAGRAEREKHRAPRNKSSGQTVQAADLSAILGQESLHSPTPPPSAGNASRARFQNRKCWWTSLVAPRIFVGSPQDLVSLMNSPGGIMYHHFYSGPP
ncbi:hypothetical protein ACRRTK_018392 [Alexandromys fortis]